MTVTSFPKDLMLKSQSNYSLVNSHEQEINTPEKATRTSQVRPRPRHRVALWYHLPIQHMGSRNHTCSIVFWTIFKVWFFSASKVALNPGPDTSRASDIAKANWLHQCHQLLAHMMGETGCSVWSGQTGGSSDSNPCRRWGITAGLWKWRLEAKIKEPGSRAVVRA